MKIINFTTQWKNNNFNIKIFTFNFIYKYFSFFLKPFLIKTKKKSDFKIELELISDKNLKIKNKYLNYDRIISNKKIKTIISINNIGVLLLKTILKKIYNSRHIGLNELTMMIIRIGIFEPIEFKLSKLNFKMIHACSFILSKKKILIIGGSKQGKSTIINYIFSNKLYKNILSDNYVFIKKNKILTLFEPSRHNNFSYKYNYYGRGSKHIIDKQECYIDIVIFLERGAETSLKKISTSELIKYYSSIEKTSNEGINFIKKNDPLFKKTKLSIDIKKKYHLIMKNGLENINQTIKILKTI